jgi:hypothetical protein
MVRMKRRTALGEAMGNESLIKGVFLVAGAALLYYLGRWIGGGLTSNFSNGTVLTGILLCLVWFGYLAYSRSEAEAQQLKFAEKAISAVILAFFVASFGLGEAGLHFHLEMPKAFLR